MVAAAMTHAVQTGKAFADQAAAIKAEVLHSSPIYRNGAPKDVPGELVDPLFALAKTGDVGMVAVPDGFAVLSLTRITVPDRAGDPLDWDRMRGQLTQTVRSDIENAYSDALRTAAKPVVNQKLVDTIIQ